MRPAVVANPVTVGDPEGLRAEIKRRAGEAEVLWYETTPDDPGRGQARQALADGADLVLVCGGDGTVTACAVTLAGSGVPLALVPTGTGNLLARNLDLPLDVPAALDVAFAGGRREIDVLDAGQTRFTVMAGVGIDAAMIRDTDDRAKQRHGWAAYVGGVVRALRDDPRARYEIVVDDQPPVRVRALGVLVGNVGRLQGGMALLPDADPADGQLDVIALTPRTWRDLPVLAARIVRRRPDAGPQARTLRGRRVSLRADRPVPLEFDGDYAGPTDRLDVEVAAERVAVCVPG